MAKTKRIYTVIFTSERNTDEVARFGTSEVADAFAEGKRHYQEPATSFPEDVPVHIAKRWGF